jgi:hypothetical protein
MHNFYPTRRDDLWLLRNYASGELRQEIDTLIERGGDDSRARQLSLNGNVAPVNDGKLDVSLRRFADLAGIEAPVA